VTFIHSSDIHSRILSYQHEPTFTEQRLGLLPDRGPYGGMARMATIVKRERERSGRVLWVDSGDLFQGAPIFNFFKGEAEIRALSQAGVDVMALGNHEFDAGAANVTEQFGQWADFPLLAANYDFERQTHPHAREFDVVVEPFVVYNLDGLRVGLIGMGNLSSMNSLEDGTNSIGVVPKATLQTVQDYANMLRPTVDLVGVVGHLGLSEDEYLARNLCGVDIILGGHHHIALNPPKLISFDPDPEVFAGGEIDDDSDENLGGALGQSQLGECPKEDRRDVLLVHPNAFTKFVGRIDLIVRDGRIRSHKWQLFPIDGTIPEDPDVSFVLEEYVEEMNRTLDLSRVISRATTRLTRFGSSGGDSMFGNFVVEAMQFRRGVETDFCLTNSLGIRTDVLQGDITLEQLFNVLPFDNTIATMFLSGIDVQELLDFSTSRSADRGCSSQVQVSGIEFTMNCRTRQAEDILIAGSPLEPNAIYEMCTNNYIAAGGSGFKVLKRNTTTIDTGVSMRDAVIDYMKGFEVLPQCFDASTPVDECTAGISVEDGRIRTRF
jgi:5'-nucleotidase